MILFEVTDQAAVQVKPMSTRNGKKVLEKDIQEIFERSLYEILGVHFLASEYSTSFGGRMDTLGIDDEGNPCIIEYKKGQNENVINQGLSYLRWLLDHREDFHVLCQRMGVEIGVQWNQPRVICIAESYSKFDTDTADLLPIKIELLRYQLFQNNMLTLDTESYQRVKLQNVPKLSSVSDKDLNALVRQPKVEEIELEPEPLQASYTLDQHLKKANSSTIKLFENLRERLLGLDQEMSLEPLKLLVSFKVTRKVVDVVFRKTKLQVFINIKSGMLEDPKNLARDLEYPVKVGRWSGCHYRVEVTPDTDLDYVMFLIQQSYDLNR